MGGEQSRPGTVRVPPPSIMPAGGPPGRGTVGGPMFVSPEHLLDLMASGHPFLDGLSHSQPPPGPLPSMVHAQQVRCDAVVDGESLRVTPSPEDPSRLHLDFSFTAHSPVEVGVTYLCICRRGPLDARPLTHPTALLSRLPKSTRRHLFQAGPKQHFSQLALAQGTPSWLILDKEVEGGVGGGETTPSTAPAPALAPAPAPATAAEIDPLAGEFLDLRQCTLKEVTHRPRSFAGCVDLLPPLTAPLPPIPPPAPQFKLGEAFFLPTTSSAAGKKVRGEEPSIPLDMSPILLTLTVLDESGAPAVPTRLQATLATLVPRASSGGGGGGGGKKDGEKEAGWDVKILVQLFQVGSQVYKTQTLFGDSDGGRGGGGGGKGGGGEGSGSGGGGGSSSGGDGGESGSSNVNNSSSSSSDDTIKGTDCVICLSEPRTTALLPCRHLALCAPCAQQLRFQSNKCPICRSIITSLLTWGE